MITKTKANSKPLLKQTQTNKKTKGNTQKMATILNLQGQVVTPFFANKTIKNRFNGMSRCQILTALFQDDTDKAYVSIRVDTAIEGVVLPENRMKQSAILLAIPTKLNPKISEQAIVVALTFDSKKFECHIPMDAIGLVCFDRGASELTFLPPNFEDGLCEKSVAQIEKAFLLTRKKEQELKRKMLEATIDRIFDSFPRKKK